MLWMLYSDKIADKKEKERITDWREAKVRVSGNMEFFPSEWDRFAHTVPHDVKWTVCILGAVGWGWKRSGTVCWRAIGLNRIKQASLLLYCFFLFLLGKLQSPWAEWTSREHSQAWLPKFLWSLNTLPQTNEKNLTDKEQTDQVVLLPGQHGSVGHQRPSVPSE